MLRGSNAALALRRAAIEAGYKLRSDEADEQLDAPRHVMLTGLSDVSLPLDIRSSTMCHDLRPGNGKPLGTIERISWSPPKGCRQSKKVAPKRVAPQQFGARREYLRDITNTLRQIILERLIPLLCRFLGRRRT